MPKQRRLIRVYKKNYTPRDPNLVDKEPLAYHIYGVDRQGRPQQIEITNTKPRFWIKRTEMERPDWETVISIVTGKCGGIVDEGYKSIVDDSPLLTVYVSHPQHVPELREMFGWTGQANVRYADAVTGFYGLSRYLSIPTQERGVIEDVKPISEDDEPEPFKFPEAFFDIEWDDTKTPGSKGFIKCATFLYENECHVAITKRVDADTIQRMCNSPEFLLEACSKGETCTHVPAMDVPVFVTYFDPDECGDYPIPEEYAEIKLYYWIVEHLKRLAFVVGHYVYSADFRTLMAHANARNGQIRVWNDQESMKRTPYPSIYNCLESLQVVDSMELYLLYHYGTVRMRGRRALDYISKTELASGDDPKSGYGKIKRGMIHDLYIQDPEFLCVYNIWDCELLRRIFKKTDMLNFARDYAEFEHCTVDNFGSNVRLIESELRWTFRDQKFILPTPGSEKDDSAVEIGGYVKKAPNGIFRAIGELDNTQEYPRAIISGNIDFRSLVRGEPAPGRPTSYFPHTGNRYYLDVAGVMPSKLKQLGDDRDKYKAEMKRVEKAMKEAQESDIPALKSRYNHLDTLQKFCKAAMNSWYGALGTVGKEYAFALASGKIGTDITTTARLHVQWNQEFIDSGTIMLDDVRKMCGLEPGLNFMLHFETIYQDTDSCKWKVVESDDLLEAIPPEAEEKVMYAIANAMSKTLNETYPQMSMKLIGTENHVFEVKVEKVYKRYAQWGKKKRYVGIDYRGEHEYKGLEIVRADTNDFTRELLTGVVGGLLEGWDHKKISKLIEPRISQLMAGEVDATLGRGSGYNTEGNRLKKFILWANKHLDKDFHLGDRVIYWYVKRSQERPLPPEDGSGRRILVLDWEETPADYGYTLDYQAYKEQFLDGKTVTAIFNLFNTTYEASLEGLVQVTFERFI